MIGFAALSNPFQIGNLKLNNRIVMPPMATNFAGPDGSVNERHIAYYVRRAQGGAGYITTWEALSNPASLGRRVLVVGGGGIGAEVADYLSEKGKEITLIEMREGIALDLPIHLQHFLNLRLKSKGVEVRTLTKAVRFQKDCLWIEASQGIGKLEGFDSTVIALGSVPNDELAKTVKISISEGYVVGDAVRPRELMEALAEAEEAALKI
jgi:pyruvate/2-oxoglutarate dehydrogenase complex dihydrolipoamide dehydrogenase (E3) component